jgi:Zn-dependent peptidase ImmA (M78 family)
MVIRKKGFKVPPLSTQKIREQAAYIRDVFKLGRNKVNMIRFIEFVLPTFFPEFSYAVLTKDEMGDDEARTYPDKYLIEIREDVYDAATDGDRRAQFTLAHEVGHLVLHAGLDKSVRFARSSTEHKIYEDSEWQADVFAAEFLMPYETAVLCKRADEISEKFEVSQSAAKTRFEKIH